MKKILTAMIVGSVIYGGAEALADSEKEIHAALQEALKMISNDTLDDKVSEEEAFTDMDNLGDCMMGVQENTDAGPLGAKSVADVKNGTAPILACYKAIQTRFLKCNTMYPYSGEDKNAHFIGEAKHSIQCAKDHTTAKEDGQLMGLFKETIKSLSKQY